MHTKAKLEKLSHVRMIALISFLLSWLKATDPKAYRRAELAAGLERGGGKRGPKGKGKGKRAKRGGGKHRKSARKGKKMSPKLKAFLKKHHRFPKKGEL